MVGIFLFGVTFLIYCIWHRLGTANIVIVMMVVMFPILFLYYGGVVGSWFTWLRSLNLSAATIFTLFGAVGMGALVSTYPLMRNATLYPKSEKLRRKAQSHNDCSIALSYHLFH